MSLQWTVRVTRWWVGRDNADLTEPTPRHANYLTARHLHLAQVQV